MFETFTPKQYLKIDIANNFGHNLDKDLWTDRIAWFDANEDKLEELAKQADEPALYSAGVFAWRNVQKGNVNHYPISLDATSSGIQILSCLTGDRKGAELCNVVDVGKRQDAYKVLYEIMVEKMGGTAQIDRKDCKRAIMTSFYNSEAVPKEVFGEGAQLQVFFETMEEGAPGAWELNQAMLDLWNPEALSNDWVLPDNFHVHVKIMGQVSEFVQFMDKPFEVNYSVNMPIEKGRSLGANMTHSIDGMIVREMAIRCNFNQLHVNYLVDLMEGKYGPCGTRQSEDEDKLVMTLWDHYKDSGFLSARILDYLCQENIGLVDRVVIFDLIASLPAKPFEVISVHDCFRCLPNYGNDLRKQYNILLATIAKSDLLSFILSQITGRRLQIGKLDEKLYLDIMDANYSLS